MTPTELLVYLCLGSLVANVGAWFWFMHLYDKINRLKETAQSAYDDMNWHKERSSLYRSFIVNNGHSKAFYDYQPELVLKARPLKVNDYKETGPPWEEEPTIIHLPDGSKEIG